MQARRPRMPEDRQITSYLTFSVGNLKISSWQFHSHLLYMYNFAKISNTKYYQEPVQVKCKPMCNLV